MKLNNQDVFGKGYFEEGQGLKEKKAYSWENKGLYFKVVARAVCHAFVPEKVLDIGCAKGYLVSLLDESGVDAYGVDVSSYAISCAPEKIKNKLFALDISKKRFPFPDNLFDLIIILEVVEHLNSFEHLSGEIRRTLKPGGHLLLTTPTPWGRHAKADKTHINVRPRRFWIKLFRKNGLAITSDKTWRCFKARFLKEFKESMPGNPASTRISEMLIKMGPLGNRIRNNIIPYLDYFSPLRSDEILFFKKVK